jgi:hypothetical protein
MHEILLPYLTVKYKAETIIGTMLTLLKALQ